jgi:hypothetical protein
MKSRTVALVVFTLILVHIPYAPTVNVDDPVLLDVLAPEIGFPSDSEHGTNSPMNTRAGGVTFTNVTPEVGLDGIRGDSYAWGDYNNDVFIDLLVKDHVNGKSHLFENNGPPNWDFTDVTEEKGLEGAGYAVWGDYNNDGFLDFYSVGQNNDDPDNATDTLWKNNGPPDYTFFNATYSAGQLDDGMPGLAAGWADYDRDGFLDLYVVNWRDLNNVRYPDVLYHNDGDGTFTDVTSSAGVWEGDDPYAGMGMNWGDYNNDGWPDIYVSNYLVMPNYLYENNQDGTFTNVAFDKNAAGEAPADEYYGHTAGSSWCDYDHDGDLDMWVTNLAHTTDPRGFYTDYSQMLRNNGPPDYDFTDVRDDTGIEKKPYMSTDELHFGIAWGDYDNDGDYDMFIPQIKNVDYAYSYFFENNGDGTFTNVSDDVGVKVWNTDGACWADYNNDGYIDLITEGKESFENGTYQVRLFRNNGESGYNWLKVHLEATESNFASIGARVKVSYDGITMTKEVEGGTAGHAYQHSMTQHFGFGDYSGTVDVEVWWPSGRSISWQGISLNQMITIKEHDSDLWLKKISFSPLGPDVGEPATLYAEITNSGNNPIDSAKVRFYYDEVGGELIGTYNANNVDPGAEIMAFTSWDTSDVPGVQTIWVSIEDVSPTEGYSLNNEDSIAILVAYPDPMVGEITFSEDNPEEGDIVTISARIRNFGYIDAESAKVTFYDTDENSTPIFETYMYDLEMLKSREVQTDWDTTGKVGEHTIIVKIEDVIPKEISTANNRKTRNIVVDKKGSDPPPSEDPNNPPEILDFTADSWSIMVGETCVLTVNATDADGDTLTYTYEASDGLITGLGSSVIWFAPDYEGNFEISVTVSDFIDETSQTISIEVRPNSVPTLDDVTVSSDSVYSNGEETILITVKVFDENGMEDISKVRIDLSEISGSSKRKMNDDGSSGDEVADDGIYSIEVFIPNGIEPGEKTLTITVTDRYGDETAEDISITILADEKEGEDDPFSMIFDNPFYILLLIVIIVVVIVALVAVGLRKRKGKSNQNPPTYVELL